MTWSPKKKKKAVWSSRRLKVGQVRVFDGNQTTNHATAPDHYQLVGLVVEGDLFRKEVSVLGGLDAKERLRGKEAINAYYLKDAPSNLAAGITVADDPVSDVGQSVDLAWQWGTYRNTDKAGTVVESGKYLTVFERRGGKWKIVRDMWNSDSPAAPAAPGAARAAATAATQ